MSKSHRACPHPDCRQMVSAEMFGRRTHWFQLPKPIRDAIWASHRAGDRVAHSRAMMDAVRYWQAANEVGA